MDAGLPGGDDETLLGDTQLALRKDGPDASSEHDRQQRDPFHERRLGRTEEDLRIGRYLVHGTLGQGGMGKVLRVHDETLGRDVALKVLLDAHGDRHGQRLLREAQALARLSHPNVVRVFDVGETDGRLYMAMELVPGTPLDRWQREPRPWSEAAQIYLQAGRGLAAAHAAGLVHRDFKPANCMIDEQGTVKVLDFGLARGTGNDADPEDDDPEDDDPEAEADPSVHEALTGRRGKVLRDVLEQQLTRTGAMLGTLAYMAPEQLLGEPADARSDQFSFCVSLFEAMFGKRPFVATSALGHLQAIQSQRVRIPPVPDGCPPVPKWLIDVLQRGLSVASDQRWPSMDALLSALERGLARRRRIRNAAIGVALLVGLGGGLRATGAWQSEQPCAGVREQPMPAWSADDRTAVATAIEASGMQDAARASERVVAELDAYAAGWVEANADACEATLVRHEVGEQALLRRRACLDERVVHVRTVVKELASADEPTAARAPEVVDRLPELATCNDVEALLRGPEPVPNALADQAAEVRELVARSWVTSATGHDAGGVEAAEQAVRAAEALPEAPVLRLEALQNRGAVLRLARRWSEARRDLEAALELAERLQDSARALEVLEQLVLLSDEELDLSAARTALAAVRGKLTRLEHLPRRNAQRWWLESVVAFRTKRYDDALAAAERAVALYEQLDPPVREEHLEALTLLGDVHRQRKELDEARKAFERALELAEAGARVPSAATALFKIGHLEYSQGKLDAARSTLERVLALREIFYGEQATPNIRTRHLLAVVLHAQGARPQALEQANLARQSMGPDVPAQIRGQVYELLGGLHRAQDHWDDAIASYRQAKEAWRSLPEPNRINLAGLDSNLADCLVKKGELELARPLYDNALATFETEGADDLRVAYARLGRSKLLIAQARPKAAIADLRHALELDQALSAAPLLAADLRWTLGQAVIAAGDMDPETIEAAITGVRSARDVFANAGFTERSKSMGDWLELCGPPCASTSDQPPTTNDQRPTTNDQR